MSPESTKPRSDEGFSLPEVIIALGLLGVVLMISFAALFAIQRSSRVATAQGQYASAFADPMEEMSRMLMQNTSIDSADANRIQVWTDRDLNGQPELNAFYVNSSGELVWEEWFYNSGRSAFWKHNRWVMDNRNANLSAGTPLFRYYDRNKTEITGLAIAEKGPSDTVYLKATLVVRPTTGVQRSDTREISFRNRN